MYICLSFSWYVNRREIKKTKQKWSVLKQKLEKDRNQPVPEGWIPRGPKDDNHSHNKTANNNNCNGYIWGLVPFSFL